MYKNWQYWSIMTILMVILGQVSGFLISKIACLICALICLLKMVRTLN